MLQYVREEKALQPSSMVMLLGSKGRVGLENDQMRTDVFLLLCGQGHVADDGLELRLVRQRHEVPRDAGKLLLHLRAKHLQAAVRVMAEGGAIIGRTS